MCVKNGVKYRYIERQAVRCLWAFGEGNTRVYEGVGGCLYERGEMLNTCFQ